MGGEKGGAVVDYECAGGRDDEKQEFLGVKLRKRVSVGWKGGPCTPVPNWKLEPGPSAAAAAALSARKLGANLWEMEGLSQSPLVSRREGKASRRKSMEFPDVSAVSMHRSAGSPRTRASAASAKHHKLIESIRALRPASPASNGSSMEVVTPCSQALSPGSSLDLKGRLQDTGYSLKTSTELLKMTEEPGDINAKGSITDRLSGEIKKFLQARQAKNGIAYQKDGKKESNLRRHSLESVYLNKTGSAPLVAEDCGSTSSDLQCFELNMNTNATPNRDQPKHCGEITENCESSWRKDTAKLHNGIKKQLMEKVLKSRHSHTVPETGAGANQIELAMSQKLEKLHLKEDGLHDKIVFNLMKNSSECSEGCKVHPYDDHAEDSNNHLPWRGRFVPVGTSDSTADIHTVLSPARQWNHWHASPVLEISECSSELPPDVKTNTLKAKLLEARLKGKNSRLKSR
ncbi:hypothetical protein J5N97_007649 [Dioscorea zingiberensis]|uniref:Uncharacterized protein n=1 Tax=Dioscorea zingiberensis TaxID=325984 RepID=A0A9D5DCB1_9LILI|nr:hypothetical protein J5N97_007649 [Dioscorea zingiberensis]